MAALHDMLTITIVDGDAPIATAEIEPDLDESGDVRGPYKPLVEFRVLNYSLHSAFDRIRPVARAVGEAELAAMRRDDDLTDAETDALVRVIKDCEAVTDRLVIVDASGAPMHGKVTRFHEYDYGEHGGVLHSIGIAMALEYVQPPPRKRLPVVIDLHEATIETFVRDVFDHETPEEGRNPWYYPHDVSFEIDARRLCPAPRAPGAGRPVCGAAWTRPPGASGTCAHDRSISGCPRMDGP